MNCTIPLMVSVVAVDRVEDLCVADWIGLRRIWFTENGVERTWEAAFRPRRAEVGEADGVFVVAITNEEQPSILLVKQYRPPAETYCLEFPAGLVDPKETAVAAGLRELTEETGYQGTLLADVGVGFLSPGLTNESCKVIVVLVDMADNDVPTQNLDHGECIEVQKVPVVHLWSCLQAHIAGGGTVCSSVQCLALGLTVAARGGEFNLTQFIECVKCLSTKF